MADGLPWRSGGFASFEGGAAVSPSRPATATVADLELSGEARNHADQGIALFESLAERSGKSFDDPVNIEPFAGGVAVVRAIRGGGKIFVADAGSVMYRAW